MLEFLNRIAASIEKYNLLFIIHRTAPISGKYELFFRVVILEMRR